MNRNALLVVYCCIINYYKLSAFKKFTFIFLGAGIW